MFGKREKLLEKKVEEISDELNRKISELHLIIRSGKCTPEELAFAKSELKRLRGQLETKMIRISSQQGNLAHGT